MSDKAKVINVRGTSGSGKSTVVRKIMELYPAKTRIMIPGRKQPLGYILNRAPPGGRPLAVIGHYETACGGCDTIKFMDDVMARVREGNRFALDVLFEGVLLSGEAKRFIDLWVDGIPLQCLYLTTPIDVCIDSINTRRQAKHGDNAAPVNPTITTNRQKSIASARRRMDEVGIPSVDVSRDEAVAYIRSELNV